MGMHSGRPCEDGPVVEGQVIASRGSFNSAYTSIRRCVSNERTYTHHVVAELKGPQRDDGDRVEKVWLDWHCCVYGQRQLADGKA